MKLKIDIEPYFCPKCGQFRNALQTERGYNFCDSYGYRPDPKLATRVEGIVRTCILCGTKVHDTPTIIEQLLRKSIVDNYSARKPDPT